jgi:predicted DsbA family dithiol-disulfide isomerase
MTKPLRIDVISDVACPWCAVGLFSLQLALSRMKDAVDTRIFMHPFELNPDMEAGGQAIVDYMGKKYGRTPAQIAESQAYLRERGASVGFTFGSRDRVYNTFDAHRLLYWAGLEASQLPLKMELLRAYHQHGKDPGNHDVLAEAAENVGLDAGNAREVLQTGMYAEEVRAEEQQYTAMGIHAVPAFIFNQKYLVSGGQPPEEFERVIGQILAAA